MKEERPMATVTVPTCFICGSALKVTLTHSQKGKVAVGLTCPTDGRHFRGFVNHRPFVETVIQQAGVLQNASKTEPTREGD